MKKIYILTTIGFIIFLFIFIPQIIEKTARTVLVVKQFHGKSIENKRLMVWKFVYEFADEAKRRLPGVRKARFITDMDLTTDPGQIILRGLAFHLYPIDFRIVKKENPEVLIYFKKRNAIDIVPPEYKPFLVFDEEHLIAVRKK